jgi:hypothetical protein
MHNSKLTYLGFPESIASKSGMSSFSKFWADTLWRWFGVTQNTFLRLDKTNKLSKGSWKVWLTCTVDRGKYDIDVRRWWLCWCVEVVLRCWFSTTTVQHTNTVINRRDYFEHTKWYANLFGKQKFGTKSRISKMVSKFWKNPEFQKWYSLPKTVGKQKFGTILFLKISCDQHINTS